MFVQHIFIVHRTLYHWFSTRSATNQAMVDASRRTLINISELIQLDAFPFAANTVTAGALVETTVASTRAVQLRLKLAIL